MEVQTDVPAILRLSAVPFTVVVIPKLSEVFELIFINLFSSLFCKKSNPFIILFKANLNLALISSFSRFTLSKHRLLKRWDSSA